MSSNRIEQQLQQQHQHRFQDTCASTDSQVRRSSLVVNLSTTRRRRSLVTRLLTSSSKTSSGSSHFTFSGSPLPTFSSFPRADSSVSASSRRLLYTSSSPKQPSSQSAPPTLSQPSFDGPTERAPAEARQPEAECGARSSNHHRHQSPTSCPLIAASKSPTMQSHQFQVSEVVGCETSGERSNSAAREEPEVEPIVEVRHTSSSCSSASSSRDRTPPRHSADSSGGAEPSESASGKHRRTVRRFHKTTTTSGGLVSENNEKQQQQESQFRTRQLSNYSGQQQQVASSTTSKIAKCTSITTNHHHHHRKLLTTHHRQLVSSTGSTSSSSNQRSHSRIAVSSEMPGDRQALASNSNLFEPAGERGARVVEEESSNRRRIQVEEEEESSVRHSRFSSTSSQFGAAALADARLTQSTSTSTSSTCQANRHRHQHTSLLSGAGSSAAESRLHFETANESKSSKQHFSASSRFLDGSNSPDMRSLVDEIVVDFAELENCAALSSAGTSNALSRVNSLSKRLFNRRPISPLLSPSSAHLSARPQSGASTASGSATRLGEDEDEDDNLSSSNEDRIGRLLRKVKCRQEDENAAYQLGSASGALRPEVLALGAAPTSELPGAGAPPSSGEQPTSKEQVNAVLSESIDRIDQRMSDLCKKLQECQDSQKAIQLLKIMIQMIEKAWSVPVCGDDLGFKLCNSIRISGGLDIILNLIEDAGDASVGAAQNKTLRLNLSRLASVQNAAQSDPGSAASLNAPGPNKTLNKDSDSDLLTSDLGLDSTSIESLSAPPATAQPDQATTPKDQPEVKAEEQQQQQQVSDEVANDMLKEELVFLSARLLSQCITSPNRNYMAEDGLKHVVKVACKFIFMKSKQSMRILSRSSVVRQSSHNKIGALSQELRKKAGESPTSKEPASDVAGEQTTTALDVSGQEQANDSEKTLKADQAALVDQPSEMHATIGAEILEHLFKHSETTCAKIIDWGGLEAILYGCRSTDVETLRRCASALANLALYAGPEGQQTMIKEKAHVWLFPLAFHEDDNIKYYACLAIVVLAANLEIEADVQKSSTLDLVEPFVTSHEPRKFAESTTSHIHGQSDQWLRRLLPLLESRREEARNLGCFHLAMEAYIKREQGQTRVFSSIGALEPLRKVAGSPFAIASKFACQALRLIGEREPHKLTQQVPVWNSEDVSEWVRQIGFERFRTAFIESKVDGDLLLQLDDEMLQNDIRIENGIIRRRFLRELSHLKGIADYSSVDRTNLGGLLQSSGKEFLQYIYPMLQIGVTRDNLHLLDSELLMRDCKVTNTIHLIRLAQLIKSLQEKQAEADKSGSDSQEGQEGHEKKKLDVFVSYRRATGSQLASLLKVHLQLRGFSVFIDVEKLEAGKFDNNLLESIKSARNFILVLSPEALDRCMGDTECKDWVHKEIVAAMAANCNIIPVMDNFVWPDPEQLPEDMRSISKFNGVRWIHDYQDACVDKIERFIRGEFNNRASSFLGSVVGGGPTSQQTGSGGGGGRGEQRASSAASNYSSTPSLMAASGTPSVTGYPSGPSAAAASSLYSTPLNSDSYHPLAFASQQYQMTKHSQAPAKPRHQPPTN